jgi:POT family proton-dependent oligopeptide transporter
VFAVSELLLSPIGLSVTTKLAPEAFRAQMMALYFFSVGLGTSMSGVLAPLLWRGQVVTCPNRNCSQAR